MENERYILLQYSKNEYALDEIAEIYHEICQVFKDYPGTKIIAIPDSISWYEMDREELIQVRNIIDWVLEKKNDTNSETRAGSEDCS